MPSWLLNQAAMPAQRLVADGLAQVAAHRSHFALLSALDEAGPSSQADLGRRCGIDRSDVVETVNQLTVKGYVERAPDPADRRRNVVTISRAGRRHLVRLEKRLARIQDELLAPLRPSEREVLVRLLSRVVDHHADG